MAIFDRRRCALLAASAFSALLLASCGGGNGDTTPAQAPLSTTYVFGASLTDTGNVCPASPGCPPSPPYATGRFSNGPLWIETVAARYGATVRPSNQGGTNFARAGAVTGTIPGAAASATAVPNMVAQVSEYLLRNGSTASPTALYVIDATTFGNNISAALTQSLNATNVVTQGVTDITLLLQQLYAAGARYFLVANVPDVGRTPLVRSFGAAASVGATQLSAGFNQGLAAQVAAFRAASAGATVYSLDFFALNVEVATNPAAFNLTNTTDACVTTTSLCTTPATYFYWDAFHPTQAIGAIVASRVIGVISP